MAGLVLVLAAACSSPAADTAAAGPVVSTEGVQAAPAAPGTVQASPEPSSAAGAGSPLEAAVAIAEAKETIAAGDVEAGVEITRGFAHPDGVDQLTAGVRADLQRRDDVAPAGLLLRVAVVETMVVSSSDTEALVALWTAEFVTGAGNTRVTYNTLRYELAVHDGDWRLIAQTSTPGPVPTPVQEPSDPSAFEAALVGFSDETGQN